MKSNWLRNTLLGVAAAAAVGTMTYGVKIYETIKNGRGYDDDEFGDILEFDTNELELYGVLKERIDEAKRNGDEQTTIDANELDALGLDKIPAVVVKALHEDGYVVLMTTTSQGDVYYISWRED